MSDKSYLITMGERISQRRKEKKLTQEQLAETIGVSLQTISNIECGKKGAKPENIAKICISLEATADYILLGKKSENQMKNIIKIISELSEREYRAIEEILDIMQSNRL